MKRLLIPIAMTLIGVAVLAGTTFYVPANNASGKLKTTIDDDDTSVVLDTGDGAAFPSTYPYPITIGAEILKVTNRSGDTLTVERGAEDTAAVAHNAGVDVEMLITAKFVSDLNTAVNALEAIDNITETELDTETELETQLTDVTDVVTNVDANYAFMINSAGTNGQVWTSDGTGRGYWAAAPSADDMGDVDTEAELEAALTDVTDVLTDVDAKYAYLITSAGTDGQVWTSDGTGAGAWATPTLGGVDTEAEFEAAILDASDFLTSNDTLYQYLINGAGTASQIWTSDGTGRGYWAAAPSADNMGDVDTEAELEAALTDVADVVTSLDALYTYLINAAGTDNYVWTSDGDGKGGYEQISLTWLAAFTEAQLETALSDVTDVLTNKDTNYAYMIDSAGTNGYVWTSDGDGKGGWAEATGGGDSLWTDNENYISPDECAAFRIFDGPTSSYVLYLNEMYTGSLSNNKKVFSLGESHSGTIGSGLQVSGLSLFVDAAGGQTGGTGNYIGVDSKASASGSDADVVGLYGVKGLVSSASGSQVDNGYCLYAGPDTVSGTMGNLYGLYVASITGATNCYAIYTGAGGVHFGGSVDTDGDLTVDGQIKAGSTPHTLTTAAGLIDPSKLDITGLTNETSVANDDTIVMYDTSESAVREVTRGNFIGSASGIADTLCVLLPRDSYPTASAYATLDTRNNTVVLDFDAAADEAAIWTSVLPVHYGGGGLTVEIHFAMTTEEDADEEVIWAVAIEALSGQDLDSDSFAAAQTDTETVPTTCGVVDVASIAFTSGAQMDSLAAGGAFRIKVYRDADDAGDDAEGDAELIAVHIKETAS